ncbi:hypothetical protein [Massilia eburnea]|uniref:hypothetical protein n=1 Tax=Massilia eburnea TaxID=1776165 RepID=UPI001E2E318C|nr:hypothetical protein [Massilia eburnea]
MLAGIWVDVMFRYETPLIVNVSASLDATLVIVPEVNRQTLAGPFNTVGKVIAFGLLQIAVDFCIFAALALLRILKSANIPNKQEFNDILNFRAVLIMSPFLFRSRW